MNNPAISEIAKWNIYGSFFNARAGDGLVGGGIDPFDGFNGENEIFFADNNLSADLYDGFQFSPTTLAVTLSIPGSAGGGPGNLSCPLPPSVTCGIFTEADVVFNNAHIFSIFEFRGVLLHELGHVLGHKHNNINLSTMAANYNELSSIYLSQSDAQGVRAHYPDRVRTVTDIATYPFYFTGSNYNMTGLAQSTVRQGERFTLRNFTIENIGTESVSNVRLNIFFVSNRPISSDPADLAVDPTDPTVSADSYLIGTVALANPFTPSQFYETVGSDFTVPSDIPPGTYFIGAVLFHNTDQRDSVSYNNAWVLDASRQITVTAASPDDDHSNTSGTATGVGTNSSTSGAIETGGDRDYFRIDLTQAGTLTVQTLGSTDTFGTLTDQGSTINVTNDNGGEGMNFLISEQLTTGTYFVEVRGFDGSTTGSYTLVVDFQPDGGGNNSGALENPGEGSFKSGLGIISGWVCEANRVEVEVDGVSLGEAAYGTSREDTRAICGDANNGFGLLWNWNLVGSGPHTIRVFADGSEFASANFRVTTFGVEFLSGVSGQYLLLDFPQTGTNTLIEWEQSSQNFVIT